MQYHPVLTETELVIKRLDIHFILCFTCLHQSRIIIPPFKHYNILPTLCLLCAVLPPPAQNSPLVPLLLIQYAHLGATGAKKELNGKQ